MAANISGDRGAQYPQYSILVVDDSPEQTELARTVLLRGGFKVHCANSANEALQVAAANHLDLAILDIFLEDGCLGKDLMINLRKTFPNLLVIFVSGLADGDELNEALGYPKTAFIKKPYRVADFLNSVESVLAGTQCQV